MTRNRPRTPKIEACTPGERLIDGLKEVLAHTRGEIALPTRTYEPPPAEVAAVRKGATNRTASRLRRPRGQRA